jgi:hypothetical protein
MEAHGVGKGRRKHIVVAAGEPAQNIGERAAVGGREVVERRHVSARQQQGLERPGRPEGNDDDEALVLADDALAQSFLER